MYNLKKTDNKRKKEISEYFEFEKYNNKEYLFELQNFLDKLDNVENEELRLELIYKMHRLENIISEISINIIGKEINN